jgi:hydroxymethylpyrimidine pyrophosphatase-like HAD family hydrolase
VDEANAFLQSEGFADLKVTDNGRIFVKSDTLNVKEPHAYHLLPKATDKGSAIRKDQEIRKIKKEETISIGDSEADLPLANEVETLFLVANAIKDDPELPKKAQKFANVVVTKSERGLGWAGAVQQFLR